MPTGAAPFLARLERFDRVGSTNDIVRGWLAGDADEVCIAVADEQTAGRGREGRTWAAPAGAALLLSAGFRPTQLAPDRTWRLAAIVALAMAEAAEQAAGLEPGTIALKWPNDLVVATPGPDGANRAATDGANGAAGANGANGAAADRFAAADGAVTIRKVAGILGETEGLGTDDPRAVVGIGINVDWPAAAFPPELAGAMTSLREVGGRRPVDREALLDGFLDRLEARHAGLRTGAFDADEWAARQATTGRLVQLVSPDGSSELLRAVGVDGASGALLVEDPAVDSPTRRRAVLVGEITHLRIPSGGAV